MIYINRFFSSIFDKLRKFYLESDFYDKIISKIKDNNLVYKPSPHLLSSLIKYQKKKIKIDDFSIDEIWDHKNLNYKDFKNLNSFYWFFSLDLKSCKKTTQSIITKWVQNNFKYNKKS